MAKLSLAQAEEMGMVTMEKWLESYDVIADAAVEELKRLSYTEIPEIGWSWECCSCSYDEPVAYTEDWEVLMDYACQLHPEWADDN